MLIKYWKIKYSNFNHKKGSNEFPFLYKNQIKRAVYTYSRDNPKLLKQLEGQQSLTM